MILSDIKRYLEDRGQATLSDIAIHFDSNPDAVRGMMEIWIRKGQVRILKANDACGDSCNQCNATTEIYQWVKSEQPRIDIPLAPHHCNK